ncbi:MAG: bifunctional alpha,alpha-trehalose-phosphate synthase (UDP-forming)/trehalose-phosphatase [Bacillota bacterium]
MEPKERKSNHQRIVIVSNRLPIRVVKKEGQLEVTPAVGGVATGLSAFHHHNGSLWVGWPGRSPADAKEKAEMEELLSKNYSSFPVFLSDYELEKYYYGFSNRTLWPLFHYFTHDTTYDTVEWETYQQVNRKFCRELMKVLRPDDMVWVHDYHLLLLPGMLRQKMPLITIGFFLHIPFPSMEIFRNLPWREEILQGMLGADLIGFHTYDYTRHFLSSALRILGKEQIYGQINVGDRMTKVETFPMGIDVDRYSEAVETPQVKKERTLLRQKLATEKFILSVDRLDISKGIPERLKAFESFLDQYPEWHERITYVLLCVPSRTEIREYRQLKSEIEELVGKINGRFDIPEWLPILYMFRALPFEKLIALYSEADLALVTPLRDGMNLVAKEYVACQSKVGKGSLVLSETAGASAELGEAVTINPNNIKEISQSIAEGLSFQEKEKKAAIDYMYNRIKKYNIYHWAKDFLAHLEQSQELRESYRQCFLKGESKTLLQQHYHRAIKRLLFLDYDGTLVSFQQKPEQVRPDKSTVTILNYLKADPKNTVVLISGRDPDYLSEWLKETGVDLVAEHGTWIYEQSIGEWCLLEKDLSGEWKENVYPKLEIFTDRTPGSFVEEKSFALVWHYRKADPELGELRAKELVETLRFILTGTDLQVLLGNKVVEIKPGRINKGKASLRWLEKTGHWDFILAVGDDWTDEDMFETLPEDAWKLRVGFAPFTQAKYFLESSEEVRDLLRSLSGV